MSGKLGEIRGWENTGRHSGVSWVRMFSQWCNTARQSFTRGGSFLSSCPWSEVSHANSQLKSNLMFYAEQWWVLFPDRRGVELPGWPEFISGNRKTTTARSLQDDASRSCQGFGWKNSLGLLENIGFVPLFTQLSVSSIHLISIQEIFNKSVNHRLKI